LLKDTAKSSFFSQNAASHHNVNFSAAFYAPPRKMQKVFTRYSSAHKSKPSNFVPVLPLPAKKTPSHKR
jgi:hypothetical protein